MNQFTGGAIIQAAADLFDTDADFNNTRLYNAGLIDLLGALLGQPVVRKSDRDMVETVLSTMKRDMVCDNPDCRDEGQNVAQHHTCREAFKFNPQTRNWEV